MAEDAGDALFEGVDLHDVFFEDDLLDGVGHGDLADVVEVGLGPVGLAGVGHAVAKHEAEELFLGAAARLDGVGAGAAEVADGLVGGGRDVDALEHAGAQQIGEFLGVFLVGLDLVAGLLGDLRGGDDDAVVAELDEPAGEDEAGGTGLVADAQPVFFDTEFLAEVREGTLGVEVGAAGLAVEDGVGVTRGGVGDGD